MSPGRREVLEIHGVATIDPGLVRVVRAIGGRMLDERSLCGRCGTRDGLDAMISDEAWAAISGRSDGGGLLCLWCIDVLAAERGVAYHAVLHFAGRAGTGSSMLPAERAALDEQWRRAVAEGRSERERSLEREVAALREDRERREASCASCAGPLLERAESASPVPSGRKICGPCLDEFRRAPRTTSDPLLAEIAAAASRLILAEGRPHQAYEQLLREAAVAYVRLRAHPFVAGGTRGR